MYGSDMISSEERGRLYAFYRMKFEAMRYTMSKLRGRRAALLHSRPAQYEMTACYAGKTEPVHAKIIEKGFQQYAIPVRCQCDILINRHARHLALQRLFDFESVAGPGDGSRAITSTFIATSRC